MPDKVRKQFKRIGIKYKIVILLYIAIMPFLLVLIASLYYTMQKSSRESLSSAYLEISRQINETIHFIQTDVEDISTLICINENVNKMLNQGATEEEFKRTWRNDSSMNFFMDIIGTKSYISFIALYANNGYEPYYITTDTSVLVGDIGKIVKTGNYREAAEAKGGPVWDRVRKTDKGLFERNKSDKIIMNRIIANHVEVKNIGYLMLGINASYFEDICTSMTAIEECIMVEKNGKILVEKGTWEEGIKKYISSDFMKEELGGKNSGVAQYNNFTIYFSRIGEDTSSVYYVVPNYLLKQRYGTAKNISLLLILGVMLLFFPVSVILSDYVAKPLKKITDSMQKFKKGDFSQRVEYDSNDEIGEVAKCYNDMVHNIKELIDTKFLLELKEKESELSALQAQINPHFLYNTLDSIYWKAMADGNKDTAEMVYSLARIFRLSLNQGKSLTTVEKEFELVEHYLNIQKMRFDEKLEYRISLGEEVAQCIMPKLILQPFVENAIIHGIEQEGRTGTVCVHAKRQGDTICFMIEDDGKGMMEEQVRALFDKPEGDVNIRRTPGGYAVSNVYERLKLKFKEDFTLTIESEPDRGTVVTIKIPYVELMF